MLVSSAVLQIFFFFFSRGVENLWAPGEGSGDVVTGMGLIIQILILYSIT